MCREVWKHGENLLANGERSSPEEDGGRGQFGSCIVV